MLEYIQIKNFKSLLDNDFKLTGLNLFSGLNGMGKSSIIQMLLLLRQSHEEGMLEKKGLLLDGNYLTLGTGKDVLSTSSAEEVIRFLVKWKGMDSNKFEFNYQEYSDFLPLETNSFTGKYQDISLFNENFQYLSAERLAPKSHHLMSKFNVETLKSLGKHGEYTVHYIAVNRGKDIRLSNLQHPEANSKSLSDNIDAWMSEITPGLRIKAIAQSELNIATLSFAFKQGNEMTNDFKPQNIGFGVSYVLPVITCILSAKKGDLLIIENPESHLHPAGQSVMGRLCAMAAQSGVQLIIESHSDHFLNGVRVAVKKKLIDTDNVNVFFLHRDINNASHASEVIYPRIDSEGYIDVWPDGFFDQWDKELDMLL